MLNQGHVEQAGTPDAVYDRPGSPFVFGFIGESSELPVLVEHGLVLLGGRPLGLADQDARGPQRLFFRPHDVELVNDVTALAGMVVSSRRVGGTRRVEVEVDHGAHRVEIDLPFDHSAAERSRIAFRPTRWALFPAS